MVIAVQPTGSVLVHPWREDIQFWAFLIKSRLKKALRKHEINKVFFYLFFLLGLALMLCTGFALCFVFKLKTTESVIRIRFCSFRYFGPVITEKALSKCIPGEIQWYRLHKPMSYRFLIPMFVLWENCIIWITVSSISL